MAEPLASRGTSECTHNQYKTNTDVKQELAYLPQNTHTSPNTLNTRAYILYSVLQCTCRKCRTVDKNGITADQYIKHVGIGGYIV